MKAKKTKFIISALLLFALNICNGQYISSDVMASGGDVYKNNYASLSFTIGEPVIETWKTDGTALTQGFQQSSYYATSIKNETKINNNIGVFPNPTSGVVNVVVSGNPETEYTYQLSDNIGRILIDKVSFSNDAKFDLSIFSDGLYLLKVYKGDLVVKIFKVVRN